MKTCIVVPLYKEYELLDTKEIISLIQLYKILGEYIIYLIGPDRIQWNGYIAQAKSIGVDVRTRKYENSFFAGLRGYNLLLTSYEFYRAFDEYDYMLIFQPDAFVFRDELPYWCTKGYDYIGAPWFEDFQNAGPGLEMIGVGNGGFSLRKISSFLRGLKRINFYRRIGGLSRLLIKREAFKLLFSSVNLQEDIFWTTCIPLFYKSFFVAPISDALRFSFEVHPRSLFERNQHNLPFGCHAWWRYDLEFWKPIIDSYGYSV